MIQQLRITEYFRNPDVFYQNDAYLIFVQNWYKLILTIFTLKKCFY